MPTTPQQIDLWRQSPSENQRLEFKEAKEQFDNEKLYKCCVAIANEGGGRLLLGIKDKPPRPVVGTRAFNNPVAMAEKLFAAVGFRVDIEDVTHPDGRVVVFHIPTRPRGTAYHLNGAYLMRSGEALVPMTEDQLRRIFAEGEPDWLEEHTKTGLDAQQVIDLLDTQTFFELLKLPYPTDRSGVIERLVQERLVDEIDGAYAVRRLGGLILAKRLDAFPDLSRKAPRVVVYTGTSKLETKLDQVGAKGYAAGFQNLVRFVMAQLPQNEVIEDALRKEVKLIPQIAARELLANALIHQDLSIGGASVRDGFFDPSLVRKHASALHKKIEAANLNSSFQAAWRMYHDSFADNQEEVLNAIYESFFKGTQYIDPMNLSATVTLFKDLGRSDQAAEIIKHYIAIRGEDQRLFDLTYYPFAAPAAVLLAQSIFVWNLFHAVFRMPRLHG